MILDADWGDAVGKDDGRRATSMLIWNYADEKTDSRCDRSRW